LFSAAYEAKLNTTWRRYHWNVAGVAALYGPFLVQLFLRNGKEVCEFSIHTSVLTGALITWQTNGK